ncbi:MAG: type II toxin-antitoxin system HipA family toxin [Gammaproteobacteria bacterium]|nr:type II toxin-antitoxin system HipA family toxin [Gammaproteobacteria bacterium]
MKFLYVFYENQRVGVFSRDDNLLSSFSYDEQWQNSTASFPLSLAMPLAEKTFGNKITLSFFENLLPEGDVRDVLERDYKIHGSYEFLEHFGQDCAGAVIITADEKFSFKPSRFDMKQIDMTKIYEAINKKKSIVEVVSQMQPGYLSLAGAQDKFAAILKEGKIYLPTHGAATTHIIKTPILRHGIKESVYNEFYCMELARAIGLHVAPCEILEGDYPLFITERYDRIRDKQKVTRRLHQQDFCQAQGLISEEKYELNGGPSIKNNYELLLNNITATKRIHTLQDFLSWISFNLIIGNNDSHSKNLSMLLINNRNELAPFYDLLCTAIYESLHKDFSFRIGDRYTFSKIGLNQFTLLEEELGIKKGTFTQRIKDIRDLILTNKDRVLEQVIDKHPKAKIPKRISALIGKRAKGLHLQGV